MSKKSSLMLGNQIHTLHPSMRYQVIRRVPMGLSKIDIPHESHAALSDIAIRVFTSCVNAGVPMQDALLAVYMTGFQNCLASQSDERE